MRRALAVAFFCATGSALTIVLIATALLYTTWGSNQVRDYAVEKLSPRINGQLSVAELSVGLDGEIRLAGVEVRRDGRPVASLRELKAKIDLLPLFQRRVVIRSLELTAPRVEDPASLWIPGPESDQRPFEVALGLVRVSDGAVTVPLSDGTATVADLNALVSGTYAEGRGRLWVGSIGARIQVTGSKTADVALGESSGLQLRNADLSVDLASGAALVIAEVSAGGAELARLIGQPNWRQPVDATIAVRLPGRGATATATVEAKVGGAALIARAEIPADGSTPAVRAHFERLDPAALWPGAPSGTLAGWLAVAPERIQLSLAPGSLEGIEFARGEIAVAPGWDGPDSLSAEVARSLAARVQWAGSGGGVQLAVAAGLHGSVTRWNELEVRSASVDGEVTPLLGLVDNLRARRARVRLRARGPIARLAVGGRVEVEGGAYPGARVGSLGVDFALPSIERPISGSITRVEGRGLSYGGRRVPRLFARGRFARDGRTWSLDEVRAGGWPQMRELEAGEVSIDFEAGATAVRIGPVRVEAAGTTWRGRGGALRFYANRAIEVQGVTLRSAVARLQAEGRLDAPSGRGKEGRLQVNASDVDLERARPLIRAIAPTAPPLSGQVSLHASLARRGRRIELDGSTDFADIAWSDLATPVSGRAEFRLGKGVLQAEGSAHTGRARLAWQVESAAPTSTLDSDAWRRLQLDDVRSARLEVTGVTTALVEQYLGRSLGLDASLAGQLRFPAADRRGIEIDVTASARKTIAELRPVQARVTGVWDARSLAAKLAVKEGNQAVTVAEVSLASGLESLWQAPLPALKAARLRGSVPLRKFDLRRLRRVGVVLPVDGVFSGDLVIDGTAAAPVATLRNGQIVGLRAEGIALERVNLSGRADTAELHAAVDAVQSAGGSLTGDVRRAWGDGATTAHLRSRGFDLRVLRVFSTGDTHPLSTAQGRLDASVDWASRPGDWVVTGSAKIRGARVLLEDGGRPVTDLNAELRFDRDRVLLDSLTARSGTGKLKASGHLILSSWDYSLDAVATDLSVAVGAFWIRVGADGAITGRRADDGYWVADVSLFKGDVKIEETGGDLQSVGALEDVVIVDRIGGTPDAKAGGLGFPLRVHLNVLADRGIRVVAPEVEAHVTTSDLRVDVRGGVRWLSGTIRSVAEDPGSVMVFDRRWEIVSAEAYFDGRVPIDPELDIVIRRVFPSATVSAELHGPLSKYETHFSSDRDYSQTELLAIMVGQDPDDPTFATQSAQEQAQSIVATAVAQQARNRLKLPIDIVRVERDSYSLGKWVTRKLLVGITTRNEAVSADRNANELWLEYHFLPSLRLIFFGGDSDVLGLDLLFTRRF